MAKPMESPTIAPALPQAAIHAGETASLCWAASSAAETSVISPGTGVPRLSAIITMPTIRQTASGGIDCSR